MKKIIAIAGLFGIALVSTSQDCVKTKLLQFEDATIYTYKYDRDGDEVQALVFKANMNVDADGSPRAYGPNNTGLDWTANAGKPGNWWALVTDNSGKPVIQSSTDPYPGMYVCATSLYDSNYKLKDPRRYCNSELVPYISLPKPVREKGGIKVGDFVWVYNTETGKSSYAIYADAGGNTGIGEGSMWLANAVGLGTNPRSGGGTSKNIIVYVVMPKTSFGQGYIPTSIQIHQRGLELLSPDETQKIVDCKF